MRIANDFRKIKLCEIQLVSARIIHLKLNGANTPRPAQLMMQSAGFVSIRLQALKFKAEGSLESLFIGDFKNSETCSVLRESQSKII